MRGQMHLMAAQVHKDLVLFVLPCCSITELFDVLDTGQDFPDLLVNWIQECMNS